MALTHPTKFLIKCCLFFFLVGFTGHVLIDVSRVSFAFRISGCVLNGVQKGWKELETGSAEEIFIFGGNPLLQISCFSCYSLCINHQSSQIVGSFKIGSLPSNLFARLLHIDVDQFCK
ncbi:hypothetical protein ACSQ67_012496 [Phaseolus vulgaris]